MNGYWPNEPGGSRTVLVVPPAVGAETWSADVAQLLTGDRRVTIFRTTAPAARGQFDLVLAAGPDGLARVRGKLLLIPGGAGTAPPYVLNRAALMRGDRVRPDALALAHESDPVALRNSCPEALPVTSVVGDLCYDRLLASIPFRADYRRAVDLSRGRKLIVVTLTGRSGLLNRLLTTLPPEEYRIIAAPDFWRANLVAADLVIGDLGVVTRYAAAIGLPVMLVESAEGEPPVGGAAELVLRHARRLRPEQSLPRQVLAAMRDDRTWQDGVAARITSRAGYAADLLRPVVYDLLGLDEPAASAACSPVPASHFSDAKTA